jgi:hypothetical protein
MQMSLAAIVEETRLHYFFSFLSRRFFLAPKHTWSANDRAAIVMNLCFFLFYLLFKSEANFKLLELVGRNRGPISKLGVASTLSKL